MEVEMEIWLLQECGGELIESLVYGVKISTTSEILFPRVDKTSDYTDVMDHITRTEYFQQS